MNTRNGSPVPFTVIGGFLGAGKTTLLNQILRDADGQRIVVLVNDVGDTPIDPELIASRTAAAITLTNGCICCTLGDEFALGLPDLLEKDPPIDRVVVEASGIGDPGRIAQYGTLPGFVLDGVIVLADVERIESLLNNARIGHQVAHQLQRAHLVALTKVDLIDEERGNAARAAITKVLLGKKIPIIESRWGGIPAEVLFGLSSGSPGIDAADGHDAPELHGIDLHGIDLHGIDRHGIDRHGIEVRSFTPPAPVARAALDAWLACLPTDVLRVKGLVNIQEAPSVVIQKVGPRCRVTARQEPTVEPRVVVIALAGTQIPEPVW
jgi:G3E family GTPase